MRYHAQGQNEATDFGGSSTEIYKGVSPYSFFSLPENNPLVHGFQSICPRWSDDWPHQLAHVLFVSESPYVSCTLSIDVAKVYAGDKGKIYRIRLQNASIIDPVKSLASARNELDFMADSAGLTAIAKAIRNSQRDGEILVFRSIPKSAVELIPG